MSDWRPIETAPKDGTHILIFSQDFGEPMVAYWDNGKSDFCETWAGDGCLPASHWMPLPEPPK